MERSSGILMHISSLPGAYGIGDFGKEAYRFVDFLEMSGQKNWQILPLGPTSYGDSPYQSFSVFAGNPYFIDLDEFLELGYLTKADIDNVKLEDNINKINYELLYKNKFKLLKIAYENSKDILENDLDRFYHENREWLRGFGIFMSIKSIYNNSSWHNWDREYKDYNSRKVEEFEMENQKEIFFWVFTQYFFSKQWEKLKNYANEKKIKIIGDLPIYTSEDSSDLWQHPSLFKLNEDYRPEYIAGVPPDDFTKEGQLWGNPLYDWDKMKEDGYSWWIKRIEHSFNLYDRVRIDHFKGFESYWQVHNKAENAIHGTWEKGPGIEFFNIIKESLGDLDIIIEDLGFNTPELQKLVEDTGFPNMNVLQFAFDPREESKYLPHNIEKQSVTYTGTHDNPTVHSWIENMESEEFNYIVKYLKLNFDEGLNWGIIRGAWSSSSKLAIAPIQDFLNLDSSARMNTPATLGDNWTWRVKKEDLDLQLAKEIKDLNKVYWR